MPAHACADQHAAGADGRLPALPEYLSARPAVPLLLQRLDRHLLGDGRFPHALPLPCRLLDEQHPRGYPLCQGVLDGRRRRCLGDLPVPGRQRGARHARAAQASAHNSARGQSPPLLPAAPQKHRLHRAAQHPPAELCLRRQHHHSVRHQRLRPQCHRGLFRRHQAQQPRHHQPDSAGQRHEQLHLPEYRRRPA